MQQMPIRTHLRALAHGPFSLAAATLFFISAAPFALAQAIPSTQPTSLPAPIAATPVAAHSLPSNRAEVTFADGQLNVRANNSSLHQILRAISRATGMKITGGIADERVFGDYGPAAPSTVLATLLDGTGTNILLRDGDATRPMELILTPRTGGLVPNIPATPISFDADADPSTPQPSAVQQQPYQPATTGTVRPGEDPRDAARRLGPPSPYNNQNVPTNQPSTQSTPAQIPPPMNNVNGSPANVTPTASQIPTTNSVPIDSVPSPSTTPAATQGIVDTPNPPAAGTTTGSGAKTPEQIYQQLLQMQQQKQQNPPAQPTSTPPGGPSN
jgi:hypothetical protein